MLDHADRCASRVGHVVEDADGCPERDVDADGLDDPVDACPLDAEDLDGIADTDGCPEDDADGDGVADPVDACPTEAGDGADGCPVEVAVTPQPEPVALPDNVETYFDFDTADLRPESEAALRRFVSESWAADPEQTLRVEGHTDNVGDAAYNRTLSEARAEAVRDVLIDAGVPEEQVSAVGYGATRPRYSGGQSEQNRRVEIFVE